MKKQLLSNEREVGRTQSAVKSQLLLLRGGFARDLRHSGAVSAIPAPACHFAAINLEESTRAAMTACFVAAREFVAFPFAKSQGHRLVGSVAAIRAHVLLARRHVVVADSVAIASVLHNLRVFKRQRLR